MLQNKNNFFIAFKWLVMLAAYAYLAYKLANIEYWNELRRSFATLDIRRSLFLLSVVFIMPFNWLLEAKKWQILTSSITALSLKKSIKAVLAGLNTGFITPSRVGDFAGRIIYLPDDKRIAGVLLSFVNGFILTLVITVFGLFSAYFYSAQFKYGIDFSKYSLMLAFLLAFFAAVYFLFPDILKKSEKRSWNAKLKKTLAPLSELSAKPLLAASFLSVIRFATFCFQYYLMLLFFKVELTPAQALTGIPTLYLLVTYAPTFAASEAAVRASVSVLVLGAFSNNEIGILLSGIVIWLINFVAPMLAGSVLLAKTDFRREVVRENNNTG